MKLCILCDVSYQDESPAEYFGDWDAEIQWIRKETAAVNVAALSRQNYDVFVNLCDGCSGDAEAGIEVVHALERARVPFTGAASDFYDPTRAAMKSACESAGVPTPGYRFVSDQSPLQLSAIPLSFPLIVKHPNGHSSMGLFRESRVENLEQLQAQAKRMIKGYGGALVEEFIEGREFDILVVENADDSSEPFVYRPVEFVFPPGELFKHYDLKWVNYSAMTCTPCSDPVITARLKEMSKKLFLQLEGSGYARCDIRMDMRGELHMLEINANCGIFYPKGNEGSADYILVQEASGHREFIERIIRAGFARHHRENPTDSENARLRYPELLNDSVASRSKSWTRS